MMRESGWSVGTITITAGWTEETEDSESDEVSLTETFTRLSILEAGIDAACLSDDSGVPPLSLPVGNFIAVRESSLGCGCCPCFARVLLQLRTDLEATSPALVGTRTFLGVDPPPAVDLYGVVTRAEFRPARCRTLWGHPKRYDELEGAGFTTPATGTVTITTPVPGVYGIPEEQQVLVTGDTFRGGTATFSWTSPDSHVLVFTLTGVTVAEGFPVADMVGTVSFTPPDPEHLPDFDPTEGIVIAKTVEGNGMRIIFGGRYAVEGTPLTIAPITQTDNSTAVWDFLVAPADFVGSVILKVQLYIDDDGDWVESGSKEVTYEVTGDCPDDYSGTVDLTPADPPDGYTLTGDITCTWGA
jgi:hypothetical protein